MSPPGWEEPSKQQLLYLVVLLSTLQLFRYTTGGRANPKVGRWSRTSLLPQHDRWQSARVFVSCWAVIRVERVSASLAVVSHIWCILSRGIAPLFSYLR